MVDLSHGFSGCWMVVGGRVLQWWDSCLIFYIAFSPQLSLIPTLPGLFFFASLILIGTGLIYRTGYFLIGAGSGTDTN